MNNPITMKMLEMRIAMLNKALGTPTTPWTKTPKGLKANIGNYHWSGAYGGYSLHQMCNDGGGVRDIFSCGHIPKRDLFNRICAMLAGIDSGKARRRAQKGN